MKELKPLVIAVAPNGARYNKLDHPAVPISPAELVETAVSCLDAGATMIHLHVRNKSQLHSLSPVNYIPAITAVKEAVGDQMLVQVTSEAAGIYKAEQQIDLMQKLMPDCMSIALREFVPKGASAKPFQEFLKKLSAEGCLLQYILYDEADYNHYCNLSASGVIPENNHSLLFVLGRYTTNPPTVDIVKQYQSILSTKEPWMVCTFGQQAPHILSETVALNCHVRVGFENGFYLPDGSVAKSNAEIVEQCWALFKASGRSLADINQTRELLGQKI